MNSKLGLMAASIMLGAMSDPLRGWADVAFDEASPISFGVPPRRRVKSWVDGTNTTLPATESDLFAKHGKSKSKRAKRRSRT